MSLFFLFFFFSTPLLILSLTLSLSLSLSFSLSGDRGLQATGVRGGARRCRGRRLSSAQRERHRERRLLRQRERQRGGGTPRGVSPAPGSRGIGTHEDGSDEETKPPGEYDQKK